MSFRKQVIDNNCKNEINKATDILFTYTCIQAAKMYSVSRYLISNTCNSEINVVIFFLYNNFRFTTYYDEIRREGVEQDCTSNPRHSVGLQTKGMQGTEELLHNWILLVLNVVSQSLK